jgi:hypothetical protein
MTSEVVMKSIQRKSAFVSSVEVSEPEIKRNAPTDNAFRDSDSEPQKESLDIASLKARMIAGAPVELECMSQSKCRERASISSRIIRCGDLEPDQKLRHLARESIAA